jgi:hypothetical protein
VRQDNGRASFHSLRATFISMMDEAGIPPYITDAITGHAGGGMHARYTQPAPAALLRAVTRALPPVSRRAFLAPGAEDIRPADAGPADHPDDLRLVGALLDQRLLQGFDVIHIVHRLRSLRLSMRLISAIEPKTSTLKERIATAIQAKTSIFTSDVTPILPYAC